jgi:PAS domain S-box-containing protein
MNVFKDIIFKTFSGPQIPEELSEHCSNEIDRINRARLRFLIPPIITAVLIILAVYIFNAARNGLNPLCSAYIAADSLYLFFLSCCFFIWKKFRLENKKMFNAFFCAIFFTSLLWASVLSLLDQMGYNSMTCYIMAALLFSIAFVIKPRLFTLTLVSVLLPLFAALPFFQKNAFALFEGYINAVFCSLISVFLSRFTYNSTMEGIAIRKKIEIESASARAALEGFKIIWSNVECGISIIDAETREIIDVNPVAVRMFGGEKSAITGRNCHKFICPSEFNFCPIMDKDQVVDRSECVFIRANGEVIPIIKSVAKINYNNRLMLLESFTDISNLKKAEEQLRLASVAEQANRAKSDFLSRMSHEMRTPMNAIIGMAKIAEGTDDAKKLKYCLSTIGQSSTHLLGLINDILDMSKIEAGKFELHNAVLSIEDVLAKTCSLTIEQAERKKLKLNFFLEGQACIQYIGDDLRLSQVITNLVSNAIKFTPADGEISVAVQEKERRQKSSVLEFSVTDTGIGMTEEQKNKLFNAFEQADTGISRRFGGTGLGLSISKSIIEKMGGKILVDSEIGKGSVFRFEIELEHAASVEENDNYADLNGMKILIVSNDNRICEYLTRLTCGCGITTKIAADAEEMICKAVAANNGKKPFDAIFVDYNLGGDAVFKAVERMEEHAVADAVVLMATFLELSKIDARARTAGINKFISMPFLPSNVFKTLRWKNGTANNTSNTGGTQVINEPDFSSVNLLLAEDVEINSEIFKALLERTKVNIDTAGNGSFAVEMFKRNPDKYNMIIMDIHMPEMNGYEATKAIRSLQNSRAKTIPIVAMTASVFREDIERCLACGMNDHLAKPIDDAKVIKKILEYAKAG